MSEVQRTAAIYRPRPAPKPEPMFRYTGAQVPRAPSTLDQALNSIVLSAGEHRTWALMKAILNAMPRSQRIHVLREMGWEEVK